ncbi:MAG: hypothetical protein PHG00_15385 [Methylococcales bacterium]|nr:hypothetical protein [Methylococcales bacterium]
MDVVFNDFGRFFARRDFTDYGILFFLVKVCGNGGGTNGHNTLFHTVNEFGYALGKHLAGRINAAL